ncbi:hypothetical protein AB0J65_31835, partial [Streptomyces toxytricini]
MTDSPTGGRLLEAAVRNNAAWCAAVCPGGTFTADAWTSPHRTPPYYPDAVSLSRGASAAELAAAVDTAAPGCSVKDSYAVLDLAPAGFGVLFEAQWIHRPAGPPAGTGSSLHWSRVGTLMADSGAKTCTCGETPHTWCDQALGVQRKGT